MVVLWEWGGGKKGEGVGWQRATRRQERQAGSEGSQRGSMRGSQVRVREVEVGRLLDRREAVVPGAATGLDALLHQVRVL